jgi:Transport protein Avl9
MLFFGSRCERLCMIQFALISLIPGLIRSLQDCADPALDQYAQNVSKPTSLKTSERNSRTSSPTKILEIRLTFDSAGVYGSPSANLRKGTCMTLPDAALQTDYSHQGSFFGPYTPLQQLDILADYGTKSYIVGSTNPLLLQQKDKYSDILINLDDTTVSVTSASLRTALSLSSADRRWIDFLTQTVQDTWDPANPNRPNTMGYAGSEEFIRLQFEEYLLAMLSSVSYHNHSCFPRTAAPSQSSSTHTPDEDPSLEFNSEFIHAWKQTSNYALFTRLTSGSSLFDIIEPKHPTAGGLSVEDVQRRLAQQVAELHLDERMREGRETLGKHLAIGKERFGQFSNKLWADVEALREAQRKRASERSTEINEAGNLGLRVQQTDGAGSEGDGIRSRGSKAYAWPTRATAPDLAQMQASAKDASAKAGAYLSSWGSWAKDKGKEWQEKRSAASSTVQSPPATPTPLATVSPRTEKSRSTLSPTGSEHSGVGRLSGELGRRWNGILRKGKESSSTVEQDGSTERPIEGPVSESTSATSVGGRSPTVEVRSTKSDAVDAERHIDQGSDVASSKESRPAGS